MLKKEIVNDLRAFTGAGMITKTQLSRYMGYSRVDKLPSSGRDEKTKLGFSDFVRHFSNCNCKLHKKFELRIDKYID